MNKVFRIMVTGILLLSGMHISLDRHYCGGNLVNARLTFTGESASCGMEKAGYISEIHYGFNGKCCEDKVSFLGSDREYLPEYAQVKSQPASKKITGNLLAYSIQGNTNNGKHDKQVKPPGLTCIHGKSHIELCVLRI